MFFEGITIHGMFPYVALLLLASGETRSSYAGMVIAAFGLGGILFSLSLPFLVARITERHMMLIGAICASIAFILIALGMPWYTLAAVFLLFGVGFYMLHNCIQVHVTDLSQTARATAMSMHSCFVLFRPGDRSDLLRLCLPPFRQQRAAASRRRRDHRDRARLRAIPAAPAGAWRLAEGP